jgi:cysteine desulfurase
LDYAATTPVDPEVFAGMKPYFSVKFGNPSSLHSFGQEAIAAVDKSRERIANILGANFRDIIFTASATEANNMAIRGVVKQFKLLFPDRRPEVVISTIEHESIFDTCRDLERDGVVVRYIPVDRDGIIDMKTLKKSVHSETTLVSVMYANNEIGSIQPVKEIANIVRQVRGSNFFPLFHTDAVQAFQYLLCDAETIGADLMTLSAHKLYGPKGIGVLYLKQIYDSRLDKKDGASKITVRNATPLLPIVTGGGQEFGYRSGTENVPLIVGAALAVEKANAMREHESRRVGELRDFFLKMLRKIWRDARLNGSETRRLPNNLNVWFPGWRAEDLLIQLDRHGIAASSGAACSMRSLKPSRVIQALGFSEKRAKESIRFTLGRQTTKMEVVKTLKVLREIKKEAK